MSEAWLVVVEINTTDLQEDRTALQTHRRLLSVRNTPDLSAEMSFIHSIGTRLPAKGNWFVWLLLATMSLLAVMFVLLQSNTVPSFMLRRCQPEPRERRSFANATTPKTTTTTKKPTTTTRKPTTKKPEKLEFPRQYEIPPCDPKKNKSVNYDVCRNLDAKMGEKTRQAYLRLMKYFDEMATKHKWTYFMCFGTLLGSWRHHDVIPWDHDMDFWVEYKDRVDIVDKIEAQTRFVPKQCTHHKIRLHDSQYVTYETYGRDIGRYKHPSIDMFFFNRNATHMIRSDYPDMYYYKLKDTFPLHRRPMSTFWLNAPHDVVKHLVTHYKATDVCATKGNPKCKLYEKYIPFVHRKWLNGTVEESLILNGKVLQVKKVDEMKENIPLNPYTLATKRFPQN